jgi:NADH-quinone oxidoreductase subunit L
LNLPFSHDTKFLETWLEPVLFGNEVHVGASSATKWVLAIIAVIGGLVGIVAAAAVYLRKRLNPGKIELDLMAKGWRYDEAVSWFMGGPGRKAFDAITWFDRRVIDGAVNGTGRVTTLVGGRLRASQTGLVRTYALAVVLGTAALVVYFVARTSF